MLQIRGQAGGTELTGTLYEPGEQAPAFRGAPDDDAPYEWVCDEFYEVESGGTRQDVADREVNLAFETPMPRGFETRERALEAATEHVQTQFARIRVSPEEVTVEIESVETQTH